MKMAAAGTTSASDDHLNKLVISIQSRFEGLSPPSDCCIFTVPEKLWQSNQEAYTPHVIAIRPYHRLNPSLVLEDHKLRYLQNFLQHNQECHLKDYIKKVKSWEDEARNCYDKKIGLNSDEFAEMMLLDGIFVIQLLLMAGDDQRRLPRDRIFGKPWMLDDVRRDMTLLENQMPFFAIQRLFEMAFVMHQNCRPGLLELVYGFFNPIMNMEKFPEAVMESEVKHLVDAIRLLSFQLVRKAPFESNKEIKFPPSAMELVAAGVKLRRGESKCLFDIEFENGALKIPCLALYDMTESYFQNIIAFEECYCSSDTYLIDYMAFMDHLVDTPGDAELLIDKAIIENWLSNKEAVAQLINTFGKEISLSEDYYFYSLSDKLIKHCQRPYNKWKATLKRDYCSNPWVVISVIAAVVLLLLTIAQTVCSVLSFI